MVGTMLPIGYGERGQGRVSWSLIAYGAGSASGAMVVGLMFGGIGLLVSSLTGDLPTLALVATGGVAVLYGLNDASLLRLPRPQFRRQVPSSWSRRYSPRAAGFLYGAGLGVGVATRIPVASFLLLPVWTLLEGDVAVAAFVFVCFGIGRFLPLWYLGGRQGGDDGDMLDALISRIERLEPLVALANGLLSVAVGALFLVSVCI